MSAYRTRCCSRSATASSRSISISRRSTSSTPGPRRSPTRRSRSILANRPLDLVATTDKQDAYRDSDFVIVATPTDYDPDKQLFQHEHGRSGHRRCAGARAARALIVIKSTIPVGFTDRMRAEFGSEQYRLLARIPARRARADVSTPRGSSSATPTPRALDFARLLEQASLKDKTDVLQTGNTEAGRSSCSPTPILRCASPSSTNSAPMPRCTRIDSRQVIDGVGLDPRIGQFYK